MPGFGSATYTPILARSVADAVAAYIARFGKRPASMACRPADAPQGWQVHGDEWAYEGIPVLVRREVPPGVWYCEVDG